MLIAVSILGVKENKKKAVKVLNKTNADMLHLDIMDGKFVENKTADFDNIKKLMSYNKLKLDVHIMVENIIEYVDKYAQLKPDYITFHAEATDNPLTMIDYIKNKGIKVGISISPGSDIKTIDDYLPLVDLVLVMTVNPGMGGQDFILEATEKIAALKALRSNKNYNYLIEVDGGINDTTINACQDADIVVVGNYITGEGNMSKYNNKISNLKNFKA